LTAILWGAAASAAEFSTVEALAGRWDMSLEDSQRKCQILLRTENDSLGHAIGMPAGCRRAMPVLAGVGGWVLAGERKLQFEDANGKPVLEFAPAAGGELIARGPQGESYMLIAATDDRQGGAFAAVQPAASGDGFRPAPRAGDRAASEIAAANVPASAPAGTFKGTAADVAGRYAILRGGGKDTGCMLTLDDKARGPHGSFKAILAPGCSDQGILIFDPVGWQVASGRLALVARKGHETHLDAQPGGTWAKDPKEGQPLELTRR
jgi:hypothetical protein